MPIGLARGDQRRGPSDRLAEGVQAVLATPSLALDIAKSRNEGPSRQCGEPGQQAGCPVSVVGVSRTPIIVVILLLLVYYLWYDSRNDRAQESDVRDGCKG